MFDAVSHAATIRTRRASKADVPIHLGTDPCPLPQSKQNVKLAAMPEPLAYFLSWHTYGTWLHGDARGSVDDTHNAVDTPYLKPDHHLYHAVRTSLRWPPMILSTRMRHVVEQTIREHCRIRRWKLLALNVRTTHVHVVVTSPQIAPERVMEQLKAWSTRRLREAGLVDRERRVWVEHGSTKWINDEDGVRFAADYVLNRQ